MSYIIGKEVNGVVLYYSDSFRTLCEPFAERAASFASLADTISWLFKDSDLQVFELKTILVKVSKQEIDRNKRPGKNVTTKI